MDFIFNKDKMTVKFFTNKEKIINKRIGSLEGFSQSVFTRGSLLFKGSIDIERFINSMNESFKEFDFILTTFTRDQNTGDYYITNQSDNDGLEQLEIETRKEHMEDSTLDILLPKKILNSTQLSGFAPNLTSEPMMMAAFKLTIYNEGFIIGYSMNHTLFDQASIVYYLKYLSHIYSYGKDNISLKKPYIIDADILNNGRIQFKDITEAREYGGRVLGFHYTPSNGKNSDSDDQFPKNTNIKLIYDLEEIENFKRESGQYLSKNDIISAILFKAYTFTSHLSDDQEFKMFYANNIRSRLGTLGEESIGNLSHQCRIILKVKDIREKSLLDLAKINRSSVSKISADHFKDDINWYKYMQDNKENMFDYLGKPTFITSRITNWTNFDYQNIQFDNSTPFSLKHFDISGYGVNTISFDTDENNRKVYTTPISIPSNCIDNLIKLSKDSKLFKLDKI